MITLREGVSPPTGYTLIGSTVVVIKKPNGQIATITVNLFQKL